MLLLCSKTRKKALSTPIIKIRTLLGELIDLETSRGYSGG
jgi:hypothetical protein